jgi:hypothetical protein
VSVEDVVMRLMRSVPALVAVLLFASASLAADAPKMTAAIPCSRKTHQMSE